MPTKSRRGRRLEVLINNAGIIQVGPMEAMEKFVLLLAPYAPHLAEELWQQLGHEDSLFRRASERDAQPALAFDVAVDESGARGVWPAWNADKATADTVELVVQVNGKLRARMPMPRGLPESAARDAALSDDNVRRFLEGKEVRKVIFVPDKLVNIVAG